MSFNVVLAGVKIAALLALNNLVIVEFVGFECKIGIIGVDIHINVRRLKNKINGSQYVVLYPTRSTKITTLT